MNIKTLKPGDVVIVKSGLRLTVSKATSIYKNRVFIRFKELPYSWSYDSGMECKQEELTIVCIESPSIDWQSLKTGNRLHSQFFGVVIFCSMNPMIADEFLAMDENGKVNSYCSMDPEDGWELIND